MCVAPAARLSPALFALVWLCVEQGGEVCGEQAGRLSAALFALVWLCVEQGGEVCVEQGGEVCGEQAGRLLYECGSIVLRHVDTCDVQKK